MCSRWKEQEIHSALPVLLNYCLMNSATRIDGASLSHRHPGNHSQGKPHRIIPEWQRTPRRLAISLTAVPKSYYWEEWDEPYHMYIYCSLTKKKSFNFFSPKLCVGHKGREMRQELGGGVSVPHHIAFNTYFLNEKLFFVVFQPVTSSSFCDYKMRWQPFLCVKITLTWGPNKLGL